MEKHKTVTIKLTEEQQRLIKDSTGHTVSELWVNVDGGTAAGPVHGLAAHGLESEMEEGGRVEQRERKNISNPARAGR